MPYLLLWIVAVLSSACAAPPASRQAPAYTVPPQFHWAIGCWDLRGPRIVGYGITSEPVVVRLDTTVRLHRPPHVALRAYALTEQPQWKETGMSPFWFPMSHADSIEVGYQSLSGIFWRFERGADSLSGYLYAFSDLSTEPWVLGPAQARRTHCP
jgi:hypothetical protein